MKITAPSRWISVLAATLGALAVFGCAVIAHWDSACFERDTPYLPICPAPPADPTLVGVEMRGRLAHNPGDSSAWTKLLASQPLETGAAVLSGAAIAAPNNYVVTRWRATQAMQNGDAKEAISLMVQILRYRNSPDAARFLAEVASTDLGPELLRPHMAAGADWLPKVIYESSKAKMPPAEMLPLVVAAMQQGVLPDKARRDYMRALKMNGNYLDAHGLWVMQQKKEVPLLYNPGFDQPVQPDGFDWEYSTARRSRAGFHVDIGPVPKRGMVLDVDFTGRTFVAPVVRQILFTPPGTYNFRGEYMITKLRSEGGLAWTVRCSAGNIAEAGRSPPLRETGGFWKTVEFDFTVEPACGPVVSLQLETALPYEATAGIRGRAAFDGFSLTRAVSSP